MRIRLILFFLIFLTSSSFASKIDTLSVFSYKMKKEVKNIVIVPDSYESQTQTYPVLYLLHGATDDYTFWPEYIPEVISFADMYDIIIVCPDGGRTSWYFDSPIDKTYQYETYVTSELIEKVDETYRTIANKTGRAITGLSMGGHGAFYLAFKHTDLYGAAGSTSGGLDIRPFPDGWDLPERLGTFSEHPLNWETNTVTNMIYLLEGADLEIIFDCGVNDFFYDVNKQFHEKLLLKDIAHDYIERPGGHTRDYWMNSIKYQFVFFNEFFMKNRH